MINSVILRTATRILSGIVLVFAVYLLWRGHHLPGGGFIAALVAGTGFALAAIADGPQKVREGLRISPQQLMGAGLASSIFSGVIGMLGGRAFLAGVWWPKEDTFIGTPLLFDVGVFLVVLGAILAILLSLEEV